MIEGVIYKVSSKTSGKTYIGKCRIPLLEEIERVRSLYDIWLVTKLKTLECFQILNCPDHKYELIVEEKYYSNECLKARWIYEIESSCKDCVNGTNFDPGVLDRMRYTCNLCHRDITRTERSTHSNTDLCKHFRI